MLLTWLRCTTQGEGADRAGFASAGACAWSVPSSPWINVRARVAGQLSSTTWTSQRAQERCPGGCRRDVGDEEVRRGRAGVGRRGWVDGLRDRRWWRTAAVEGERSGDMRTESEQSLSHHHLWSDLRRADHRGAAHQHCSRPERRDEGEDVHTGRGGQRLRSVFGARIQSPQEGLGCGRRHRHADLHGSCAHAVGWNRRVRDFVPHTFFFFPRSDFRNIHYSACGAISLWHACSGFSLFLDLPRAAGCWSGLYVSCKTATKERNLEEKS